MDPTQPISKHLSPEDEIEALMNELTEAQIVIKHQEFRIESLEKDVKRLKRIPCPCCRRILKSLHSLRHHFKEKHFHEVLFKQDQKSITKTIIQKKKN